MVGAGPIPVHDSPGGGQDADSESVLDPGNVMDRNIDAAAGLADLLEAEISGLPPSYLSVMSMASPSTAKSTM
jgi:hypothetical protein